MLVLWASVFFFSKQWKSLLKEILQWVIWNAVWTLNCPVERCTSHHHCRRRLGIKLLSLCEHPMLSPKLGGKEEKRQVGGEMTIKKAQTTTKKPSQQNTIKQIDSPFFLHLTFNCKVRHLKVRKFLTRSSLSH